MKQYECQTTVFCPFFSKKKGQALHDPRRSLFFRITIDGSREEISFSYKIAPEEWDNVNKLVLPTHSKWKEINKKINQASVDMERHFDLMPLKHELAAPALVKKSYVSPLSGQQINNETAQNLAFGDSLDSLITKYLQFCERYNRFHANARTPHPLKDQSLELEKTGLKKEANQLAPEGNVHSLCWQNTKTTRSV
jgi:Arm DNA-binding domain